MRLLVTGHRGYVATGIVRVLLDYGHQVIGFDRSSVEDSPGHPNLREVKGDITDLGTLAQAMQNCDAIIHAAVGTRVDPGDVRSYGLPVLPDLSIDYRHLLPFQINVSGTYYVFEIARQLGVNRVVNISSGAVVFYHVIDPHTNQPLDYQLRADTPPNFRGYYGLNKYLQEQIGEYYALHEGFSVMTLRPWWVVDGPTYRNRYGKPLTEDVHPLSPAGLICRYDLGKLVQRILEQDNICYDILYPVTGPGVERWFDVEHLAQTVDWQPKYTFEDLARG